MVNIGIIGNGMIAQAHIKSLMKVPDVKILWLAGVDKQKLIQSQTTYGIENITTDYVDMLNDSRVDAVVITTPPAMHEQMFIDSIKAKKHVLLEKPAAIHRESLERMLLEAEKHPGLIICDCSGRHSRLQPKYRLVKEMIDSGKLGEIYYIHHNSVAQQSRPGIEYHPTAKWFINKEIAGGGPVMDWGVYDLSFHLGLLKDKPELLKLNAFTKQGLDKVDTGGNVFNVEEHVVTYMEFTGGIKYFWERASNANMQAKHETRIYGTKGGVKLAYCSWDPVEVEFFSVENNGAGKAISELFSVTQTSHADDCDEMAFHFIDCIVNKKQPVMPLELAAKHLDILFKVYEAAEV
jgi:predicted dehydrogenase